MNRHKRAITVVGIVLLLLAAIAGFQIVDPFKSPGTSSINPDASASQQAQQSLNVVRSVDVTVRTELRVINMSSGSLRRTEVAIAQIENSKRRYQARYPTEPLQFDSVFGSDGMSWLMYGTEVERHPSYFYPHIPFVPIIEDPPEPRQAEIIDQNESVRVIRINDTEKVGRLVERPLFTSARADIYIDQQTNRPIRIAVLGRKDNSDTTPSFEYRYNFLLSDYENTSAPRPDSIPRWSFEETVTDLLGGRLPGL